MQKATILDGLALSVDFLLAGIFYSTPLLHPGLLLRFSPCACFASGISLIEFRVALGIENIDDAGCVFADEVCSFTRSTIWLAEADKRARDWLGNIGEVATRGRAFVVVGGRPVGRKYYGSRSFANRKKSRTGEADRSFANRRKSRMGDVDFGISSVVISKTEAQTRQHTDRHTGEIKRRRIEKSVQLKISRKGGRATSTAGQGISREIKVSKEKEPRLI